MFRMAFDDSVLSQYYWSRTTGTVSSDGSSDKSSDSSNTRTNEGNPPIPNDAVESASSSNSVSMSLDPAKFLGHIETTIRILTDFVNIQNGRNNEFYHFWYRHKQSVIIDLGAAAGIPTAKIKRWYALFYVIFVILILLLISFCLF